MQEQHSWPLGLPLHDSDIHESQLGNRKQLKSSVPKSGQDSGSTHTNRVAKPLQKLIGNSATNPAKKNPTPGHSAWM